MADESTLERLEAALLAEWTRQSAMVYFLDPADADPVREGDQEWSDFAGGTRLADSFDKRALLKVLLLAIREPTEPMKLAGASTAPFEDEKFELGVAADCAGDVWRRMIDIAIGEVNENADPVDESRPAG